MLIQVLVSMMIMGILITGFASWVNFQNLETRAISEKLASQEVQRSITALLSDPTNCQALFADVNLVDTTSMPFDTTVLNADSPKVIDLKEVPSPGGALAKLGDVGYPTSPTLKIADPGGVFVVVKSAASADLVVRFNHDSLVRPLKPLMFHLNISTSGPLDSAKIIGCGVSGEALTAKQICEEVLGFVYDLTKIPPCIPGTLSVDQQVGACNQMGGTLTGGICTLNCYLQGTPLKVPIRLGNVGTTVLELVNLMNESPFREHGVFSEKVSDIALSQSFDLAIRRIYALVGVDIDDKVQTVRFLRGDVEEINRSVLTVMKNLKLNEPDSRRLVTDVSSAMGGMKGKGG